MMSRQPGYPQDRRRRPGQLTEPAGRHDGGRHTLAYEFVHHGPVLQEHYQPRNAMNIPKANQILQGEFGPATQVGQRHDD